MKKVITMDMIGKIRRMHRRDKKTKREIARQTGLSRNTVAKWLDEVQPVEPKYRREAAKGWCACKQAWVLTPTEN